MNPIGRLLFAALCLGSAAVFAQSGECPVAPGDHSLVFEIPNATDEVSVPDKLDALGVPVRLKAAKSAMPLPDLVTYFKATFAKAGLWVVPDPLLPNPGWGPTVTGYDIETRISYSVIFQPNRDRTTTVLLGKAFVADRRDTSRDEAFAPVYPGAQDVLQSNVEAARTLSFSTRAQPEEVTRFYRDVLARDGYREVNPGLFRRANEQLRFELTDRASGGLHVTILRQQGTRQ